MSTLRHRLERPRWSCRPGRSHAVSLRFASIEEGMDRPLALLGEAVLPPGEPAILVEDERTHEAAGRRLGEALAERGVPVERIRLEAPHADEEAVEALRARLGARGGFVLAVGSGTINDLCKAACHGLERPYAVWATAPSMNGYASSIAAIERGGVKRTDPARPPRAVLADLDVIARAPAPMVAAGVGDLLGKAVADRDWALSSALVGSGEWCPCAADMVETAEAGIRRDAEGIAAREPAALAGLVEGLVLSGLAMEAAGSSSPASGGEHLVSHFLDLMAPHEGRAGDLHGRQVAVGTLLSLSLYGALLGRAGGELFGASTAARARKDLERGLAEMGRELAFLPEALRREIEGETRAKMALWAEIGEEGGERLAAFWDRHRVAWRAELPAMEAHAALLRRAGALPGHGAAGDDPLRLSRALRFGALMRRRVTVLDLARLTGLLDEATDFVGACWKLLESGREGTAA